MQSDLMDEVPGTQWRMAIFPGSARINRRIGLGKGADCCLVGSIYFQYSPKGKVLNFSIRENSLLTVLLILLNAEDQLPELLVANTDVTIQAPIDEYYQNLTVRLDELKREFTNIEARAGHEQTFEDYIQGDREFAEGVQQNSQRYYDALKVLRADTQVCSNNF